MREKRRRRWLPRLRPFAGRRLPKELRAENVARLAGALPQGTEDPGLEPLPLVVDERVCVVGSTNLDYRSFESNAECNLVILCETTNAALAAAFEDDLSKSVEIRSADWSRRALLHRLGDRLARCLAPAL